MERKFQRPLSFLERMWLCVDRAFPPYANQVVLEGSGGLDFEKLKSAVEKASEANPGSRLVLKGALRKCYWQDSGECPRVKMVDASKWDGYSGENAPFLKVRLPYNGPTCEVVYAKGDVPRLIFRSNHGVMDGMGTFTWMEDIFKVLRGEEPLGSDSKLNEKILISSLSKITRKQQHPINNIAPTGKVAKYEKGVTWKRLSFNGPKSMLLGKVGNAMAKSAWRYGDGVVRIDIPVDLRKRQDGLRCTGNLSVSIIVEITKNSTPESITGDIKNQLENRNELILSEGEISLDLVPLWFMEIGLKLGARIIHKSGKYSHPMVLSNLGLVDTQKYCGGDFKTEAVFLIPPRLDVMPAAVVLTGSPNRVEVTVSVPNALASGGRLDRFLDDIGEAFK